MCVKRRQEKQPPSAHSTFSEYARIRASQRVALYARVDAQYAIWAQFTHLPMSGNCIASFFVIASTGGASFTDLHAPAKMVSVGSSTMLMAAGMPTKSGANATASTST